MKNFLLFFLLLPIVSTISFAENFVLENQTSHPNVNQKSKIAIQWASSAKEVDEANKAIIYGTKLDPITFKYLDRLEKINLISPDKAQYFRVVVWSKGEGEPDLLTNWVDIVSNKTYTLKPEHLVPSVLMSGTGC